MNEETRDPLGDERQAESDRQLRQGQLRPLPPKEWKVTVTGRGIRCWVLDWDRSDSTPNPNSTSQYLVRWTALCDLSTRQGVRAAFARAIVVGRIAATGGEGETLIVDEARQSGFFFFTGQDSNGNESEFTNPPRFIPQNGLLQSSIPGIVSRFQITESGEERDGTMWSVLSCSCIAPDPLGSFFALQLIFQNYPKFGDVTAFGQREYGGVGGGSIQWQMVLPVARRQGKGSITTLDPTSPVVTFGGGENLNLICQAGDYLEALGVLAQIKSIDSPTQLTLGVPGGGAVNWPGQLLSAMGFTDYDFIGKPRIYCRSLSQDGNGEVDLSQLPFADVLMDGDLSAPNAPNLSALEDPTTLVSSLGAVNRLLIGLVLGTRVAGYKIYRGTGAAVAFASCFLKKTWPADHNNVNGIIQYDDKEFSTLDQEQNQVFSYYATAFNVRDQESAPSPRLEVACRLESAQDTDPTITGRTGLKQLLYNAQFAGTAAGNVNGGADQDANHFTDGANLPGVPFGTGAQAYGTGRWKGYARWYSTKTGGAPTLATFLGDGSVKMPNPSAVGEHVFVFTELEAWDTVKGAQFVKMTKNGLYVFSMYAKHNGVQPNGTLNIRMESYDNNTLRGYARKRYRDTAGVLQYNLVAGANDMPINGSDLTAAWQRYYGVFWLDATLGVTKQARMTFDYADGTVGDILICRPMLNESEEIGAWTPDMGDPYVSYPVPGDPPSGINDGPGNRIGRYKEA